MLFEINESAIRLEKRRSLVVIGVMAIFNDVYGFSSVLFPRRGNDLNGDGMFVCHLFTGVKLFHILAKGSGI